MHTNPAYQAHLDRCKRAGVVPMLYTQWIALAMRCIRGAA